MKFKSIILFIASFNILYSKASIDPRDTLQIIKSVNFSENKLAKANDIGYLSYLSEYLNLKDKKLTNLRNPLLRFWIWSAKGYRIIELDFSGVDKNFRVIDYKLKSYTDSGVINIYKDTSYNLLLNNSTKKRYLDLANFIAKDFSFGRGNLPLIFGGCNVQVEFFLRDHYILKQFREPNYYKAYSEVHKKVDMLLNLLMYNNPYP